MKNLCEKAARERLYAPYSKAPREQPVLQRLHEALSDRGHAEKPHSKSHTIKYEENRTLPHGTSKQAVPGAGGINKGDIPMRFTENDRQLVAARAPHDGRTITPEEMAAAWREHPAAIVARYTTDFDCAPTDFWYIIKDTPLDLSSMKAKRRYEITKAERNFTVREIDPAALGEELYAVQVAAFSVYPEKYRPSVDHDAFLAAAAAWRAEGNAVFGAFPAEGGALAGYALLYDGGDYAMFNVLKVRPEHERAGVNAALIAALLRYTDARLRAGNFYICDGFRNLYHETAFQDYLEKYFGFRRAYCRLSVAYHPRYRAIVKCLYPFRRLFRPLDGSRLFHKVNALLLTEEIARKTKKQQNGHTRVL